MTVYLDYAASTPVDPRVAEGMQGFLVTPALQGNAASSTHGYGLLAREEVEHSRRRIADSIGATARELVFTSGATESNNLAILGVAAAARRIAEALPADQRRRPHFVSARTEHKSVLDTLKELERQGAEVTWLEPDEWGRIPPEAVRLALRDHTLLVSVMHANNELGCINDIAGIAAACRGRGVLLHSDASQSAGKIDCAVDALGVDFLSFTAHKMHGPKGIGALYVRESARPKIAPIQFGGGHERGLRSGTLPTHQVLGFDLAAKFAREERERDSAATHALRARLTRGLEDIPGVLFNTLPGEQSLPGILNVSFEGVEGESLVTGLGSDIAVSTGSACSSATREPSYVLRALGRDTELAQSSLRLSFGRLTTEAQIDQALVAIRREVSRLRRIAGGDGLPGVSEERPEPRGSGTSGSLLTALVQSHFRKPARPPRFPEGTPPSGIRQGGAGRRAEGTEVFFELEIDGGFVKSARFSAYGCPHTLAIAAWLCEVLEGARIDTGIPGSPAEWAATFEVPTEKLGRLLIVEDALRAAIV